MPLFNRSRRRDGVDHHLVNGTEQQPQPSAPPTEDEHADSDRLARPATPQRPGTPRKAPPRAATPPRPRLVFHCQLAHGSPTGSITGFSNVKELYQRIANCYNMSPDEILFCTLNTHKIDMTSLLGAQIGLDDFIFVHKRGQAKELEIVKTEQALGLTITDNGAGRAFIKRIKPGSLMERISHVQVGDHLERIDDTSLVNWRHVEVAKFLKDIPVGATFTMRLVEPLKAGFANIGPRSAPKTGKTPAYGSGKATLRLRANAPATVQQAPTDIAEAAIRKINSLLDGFLGISDEELAAQIWELGETKSNTVEFAEVLDHSDLAAFGFTDDFVIELWGAVTDAKAGRLL